ncbi:MULTISPECIES: CpaD family pilus assembly protein [Phenylobacterium]|uniref:Pilus assembly protein CpaD n=1 Tax=Phenylobacterium koreense TaxID=266125 RepID=A0ABV2EHX9_9CAUL
MNASRILIPVLASAALAACSAAPTATSGPAALARTPTELWSNRVAVQPDEIRLAIHADGLSLTQAQAIGVFVADWRASGGGQITLHAPLGGADPAAVGKTSDGVRLQLSGGGVPASQITLASYDAGGDPLAPLIVGRQRYRVDVPRCGQEWTNIAHSANNEVQPNFGCAVTANLAAQVTDPRDLLAPAQVTPADAQRRGVVLGKYRLGEKTGSAKEESSTRISDVVK